MGSKFAAAVIAAAATTTIVESKAHADTRVDWGKVIVQIDQYARSGNAEKPNFGATRQEGQVGITDDPSPSNMGGAWFGVAPRVTLVARDWASSTRLAGDKLILVDAMRLSASTRMVVGRARLSAARFAPFLQVGLGQWRVDRNYLPLTPHTIEVASQLGGGFELRVAPRWHVAAETTATGLIREGQSATLPQTMLWSTFLASRIEF